MTSTRPLWRASLRGAAVLVGLVLVVIGLPFTAEAAEIAGPPGPGSIYGFCNVHMEQHSTNWGAADNDVYLTCNVGTAATYIGGALTFTHSGGNWSPTLQQQGMVTGKPGIWRAWYKSGGPGASVTFTGISRLPLTGAGAATIVGIRDQRTDYPEPPADYFTGGTAPGTVTGRVDVEAAFLAALAYFQGQSTNSFVGSQAIGPEFTVSGRQVQLVMKDTSTSQKHADISWSYLDGSAAISGGSASAPSGVYGSGLCLDITWEVGKTVGLYTVEAGERNIGREHGGGIQFYGPDDQLAAGSETTSGTNLASHTFGTLANWTTGTNPQYTVNSVWQHTSGDRSGCNTDPGLLPPPNTVQGPNLQCWREFEQRPDGQWWANVHGRILNPQDHATDTLSIRLPWETSDRGVADTDWFVVPLDGMTAGGWRAQCKAHRELDLGAANGLSPFALVGDGEMEQAGWVTINDVDPDAALIAPGSGGTVSTQWLTAYVGTGAAAAATAAAQGVAVTAGVVAGAALVGAGALYVGHKTGVISLDPDGCTLYDRLRDLVTDWSCPPEAQTQPEESVYLRQQVRYLTPTGDVMTAAELEAMTQTWAEAEVIAEVLLSPAKPMAGRETVVTTALPTEPPLTETEIEVITSDPLPHCLVEGVPAEECPDPEEASECPAGVSIIFPWNFIKTMKCLFVPRESVMRSKLALVTDKVPFVVVDEAVTGVASIYDGMTTALDGGCFTANLSVLMPDAQESGWGALDVTLPAPSAAGCAGSNLAVDPTNDAGNIWGWRETLRTALLVVMLLGVCFKVVSAFAPGGNPDSVRPM